MKSQFYNMENSNMPTREELRVRGVTLLHDFAGITSSTLLYGTFIPLFVLLVTSFPRRYIKPHVACLAFLATIASLLLAGLHWAAQLSFTLVSTRKNPDANFRFSISQALLWSPLLVLITDMTVTWRAWALLFGRQQWLIASSITLLSGGVASGFGFVALTSSKDGYSAYVLHGGPALRLLYASITLSAASNLTSTALIAYRLWTLCAVWRSELTSSWSYAQKSLLVIVESGALYAVLQLVTIILFRMKTEFGSLIYYVKHIIWVAYVQLTAMYPTIVLLLIGQKRSMTDTAYSSSALIAPKQYLVGKAGAGNSFQHSVYV